MFDSIRVSGRVRLGLALGLRLMLGTMYSAKNEVRASEWLEY
jgi:hypothetical protein